jgi:hypothetical protein
MDARRRWSRGQKRRGGRREERGERESPLLLPLPALGKTHPLPRSPAHTHTTAAVINP